MPNLWKRLFGGKNEALESPRTSNEPTTPDVAKTPDNLPPLANIAEEAQAEVLSQFRNGANPDLIPPEAWQDFWEDKLGVPFRQVANAFFAKGLLCEASFGVKLGVSKKLAELKSLAKEVGLKVSGRKVELVRRLVEDANPALIRELHDLRVWVCSDSALEIVAEHRARKKADQKKARIETLTLLRDQRLEDACKRVCKYESEQFYPRGMGINWPAAYEALYIDLKEVYAAQPKFHARRFGKISTDLRERAAMSILWGTSSLNDVLPKSDDRDVAAQTELLSRMLELHVSYLRNLRQLREYESRGRNLDCEIIAVDNQNTTCAACLSDSGKTYQLAKVPELPHEFCECAIGCRCSLVVKRSDRNYVDRG